MLYLSKLQCLSFHLLVHYEAPEMQLVHGASPMVGSLELNCTGVLHWCSARHCTSLFYSELDKTELLCPGLNCIIIHYSELNYSAL